MAHAGYNPASKPQKGDNKQVEPLKDIISRLERQRTAIERALAALHEASGSEVGERSAGTSGSTTSHAGSGAGLGRAAGRGRRRGRLTPEGRKRLAEAMKRRWAVKRAASTVKKGRR